MTWPVERLRLIWIDARVVLFRTILRSRYLMRLARRFPRFARIPGVARLIVHHEDARDALTRGRSFGVPYLAKMEELGGAFVLGLDDGPEHTRLRAAVKDAIAGCDFEALHRESYECAERQLDRKNRIEVVGGLTDPVLASTLSRHLGVGQVTERELDDGRIVFRDIFINSLRDPRVSRRAVEAARRLRVKVDAAVAERYERPHDDIVGRLVQDRRLEPEEIVNHGIGLLVAWSASVSRAMAFAIDALFKQPDGFELAQKAACRRDAAAMQDVLAEAFRFVPPAPGVERVCRRERPIRGQLVRREADIVVVLTSAMMDTGEIEDPGRFRVRRPSDEDLTFGHGIHACLGRELARRQMTGILLSLYSRRGLAWAYGIKLDGPYPHRLEVTW
jgi:cytochrome P450